MATDPVVPASPAPEVDLLEQLRALEAQYIVPSYARIPIVLERGKGAYVYDSTGKRYLDFISGIGVTALGHAHPRLARVIREQSLRLLHCSNLYYNPYQGPLAEQLAKVSGLERAFFVNSGTEAVEGALKIARALGQRVAPEKYEIVALNNSFHGRTMGALSVTGQPKYRDPFGPGLPGVRFVQRGDRDALTAAVGPNTCAILIEPIQGEGGIYEADGPFLTRAAELARQHQAILIADEIQCGLGRTGKYFAFQWTPVVPDVVVVAKPIANGLPFGVILARGEAATALQPGSHGTTFGGGPLVCRVAREVLEIIESERILDHVLQMGAELKTGLELLARRHAIVREVRGRGLMLGMELDRPAKPLVDSLRNSGLLVNATHETVVRMLPPYIVSSKQIEQALRLLGGSLKKL